MAPVFLRILNVSISASFLVQVVLFLRLMLKKAPRWSMCLLWALVALRLIMPFSIESRLSLLPDIDLIPGADGISQSSADAIVAPIPMDTDIPASGTGIPQKASRAEHILSVCTPIWWSGMGLMLLYSIFTYVRLRFQVRASMYHSHRVYLCDDVDSPFILGTVCPRIYIPSDIEDGQLTYVLAHENAHIRRGDHWWKPLGYLLLSVYWFNPLLWVAYIFLCRDIEQACDEKVISQMGTIEKKGYSQALLACSVHRRMVAACPVAFGEVSVKSRIKNIVRYKKPGFWIILISVVTCAVTAVCFLTDPKPCAHMEQGAITTHPSCTKKGVETFSCNICEYTYEAAVDIRPHTYDGGVVTLAPTCIREGVLEYTCLDCGDKKQEALEKTAHTPGAMTVTKEPNCSYQGEQVSYCTLCQTLCAVVPIAINDMHMPTQTITRQPTCTEDGEYILSCSLCNHTQTHSIQKTGHHLIVVAVTKATCRRGASQHIKCTECSLVTSIFISEPLSSSECSCSSCTYMSSMFTTKSYSSDIDFPSAMPKPLGPIYWDIGSSSYDPTKPVGPQPIFP